MVDKKRRIYYIDHVKFHIDEVLDLGSFVEIEVTDMEDKREVADMQKTCTSYIELLGIDKEDLLSDSYSDMLLEKISNNKLSNSKFID